jgi:hypothetical protein
LVFPGNTLALSRIAREKNGNGMEVRLGKAPNPLIGNIEYAWAQAVDDLPEIAQRFVQMKVDIIFAPVSTFVAQRCI